MDGLEACKQIKTHQKGNGLNCKVVALTGDDDDKMKNDCKAAGFDNVILKPLTKDKVSAFL